MDPLSISVSILTILGSTGSVGKAVKKLVGLRSVPDALLALNNEISDFHLIVSKIDALLQLHRDATSTSSRVVDFATEISPLLERGKARLLDLECLIEYTLTAPGQHGEPVLNKVAWLREQERVRIVQDEIRSIRTSLAALIGIFASSTSLRTESQLSELILIGHNMLELQRQSQAMTNQISTRQSVIGITYERIQPMLQELLRSQEAHDNSSSQSVSRSRSEGVSTSSWSRADGRLSVELGVPNLPQLVTSKGHHCQCLCHTKYTLQSPYRLKQLFGLLFLGYSGTPTIRTACKRCTCYRAQFVTLIIRYFFPAWFMARVIDFSLRISSSNGIDQVLRVVPIIPENDMIFRLMSENDMKGFEKWLSARGALMFGVTPSDLTLLDVS